MELMGSSLPAHVTQAKTPTLLLLLGEPRALRGVPWPSSGSHPCKLQDSELARTPRTLGVQLYIVIHLTSK